MTRDDADVRTCYLGVSFFRTLDKKRIYAGSAQVFNERGEGVLYAEVWLTNTRMTGKSILTAMARII
jgi:hypothetical protein